MSPSAEQGTISSSPARPSADDLEEATLPMPVSVAELPAIPTGHHFIHFPRLELELRFGHHDVL